MKKKDKKSFRNSVETTKLNKKLLIMDMAVGSSAEGIIITGMEGRLTYANKSFLKMFGCNSDGDALWRPLSSFFQHRKKAAELIKKARSGEGWSGTIRAVKRNGELLYARLSANTIINPDSTSLCIQLSFIDVTKERNLEQKLRAMNRELVKANKKLSQMAYRDSHTGLYSHRIYGSLIESEYQRAKRHRRPLSLMLMDVDFFKSINDVYGYIFGDVVLKQLAKKLV
ncbi:MAG: diguanylate cyclase, partial [Elusimicrobia bacterium]|nr:diguanylate cyclase [Elusimicrobiota bacterium]